MTHCEAGVANKKIFQMSNGANEARGMKSFVASLSARHQSVQKASIKLNDNQAAMFEGILAEYDRRLAKAEDVSPQSLSDMRQTEYLSVMIAKLLEDKEISLLDVAKPYLEDYNEFRTHLGKFVRAWKFVARCNSEGFVPILAV